MSRASEVLSVMTHEWVTTSQIHEMLPQYKSQSIQTTVYNLWSTGKMARVNLKDGHLYAALGTEPPEGEKLAVYIKKKKKNKSPDLFDNPNVRPKTKPKTKPKAMPVSSSDVINNIASLAAEHDSMQQEREELMELLTKAINILQR